MEDLRAYHDMVVRTVERVREGISRGLTAEEMKEEDILADWTSWDHPDYEWINTGFWIETVVQSLGRG